MNFSVKLTFQNPLTSNISGKGRADSSDEEGSFNDAASMVSDVSEVFRLFKTCDNDMTSLELRNVLYLIIITIFTPLWQDFEKVTWKKTLETPHKISINVYGQEF